jgi:ribosomal protein S18 acetylase RimI-like enzyme
LGDLPAVDNRSGFAPVVLDRPDAEAFRYRLSTVRELWPRMADLAPKSLECLALLGPDGYAVGYGFLAWGTARMPEIAFDWPLPPGEAYVHDCVILPEFRGRRLYGYLLDHLCRHARRHGATRALIAVDAGNVPSVRGIERAGFQRDREAAFRRAWSWRRVRWIPTTR